MSNRALRRAAILIATLDTDSADALLSGMSSDQAALIRNAIMELGEIDIVEQHEIMEQFVGKPAPHDEMTDGGVEFAPELVSKFDNGETPSNVCDNGETPGNVFDNGETPGNVSLPPAQQAPAATSDTNQEHNSPFAFLEFVEPGDVARILAEEHPQAAAIVVAYLSPSRAADVIGHLPRPRQSDTLMRIARLSTPHPDVIRDLEYEIQTRLTDRQTTEQVDAAGLAKVEAILQNASANTRQDLVADLFQQDQSLTQQLRCAAFPAGHMTGTPMKTPALAVDQNRASESARVDPYASPDVLSASNRPTLDFSDLEQLDDSALAQILRQCSSNTTLLALAGASHQFVRRILSQLPPREAAQLEHQIQHIGPLRLDDVQRAQQQLARAARRLVDEGKLTLPSKQRLSVAA